MNRLLNTPVTCRICGKESDVIAGDPPYCYECCDLLVGNDRDVIAQHIEDCADRTNRTVATVRKHWRAMELVSPVTIRVAYRLNGSAEQKLALVPVERTAYERGGYRTARRIAGQTLEAREGVVVHILGLKVEAK